MPGALTHKPEASVHSLRHGGITHWLEAGYSYRRVKYLARHKSVTTTEGYDRYVSADERRVNARQRDNHS